MSWASNWATRVRRKVWDTSLMEYFALPQEGLWFGFTNLACRQRFRQNSLRSRPVLPEQSINCERRIAGIQSNVEAGSNPGLLY